MKTQVLALVLMSMLFAANAIAEDCPTTFKKFNKKTVGAAMTCLKQENASLRNALNALSGGGGNGSTTVIEQLQKDVGYLMGLPKVEPIATFENDFIKASVVGRLCLDYMLI